jgi:integrase
VFVSTDNADQEFDKLDGVIRVWTRKYLENCDGIGPHAMRHILATHIIKTTLGNYFLAAQALHDRPITVEKNYAQFLPRYANAGRFESYSQSMNLLKQPIRKHRKVDLEELLS